MCVFWFAFASSPSACQELLLDTAATAPPSLESEIESEIESLKLRLSDLELAHKVTTPTLANSKTKPNETSAKSAEAKDKTSKTDVPADKWAVTLGGHVQLDYINWAQADPAIPNTFDYFEFRRLRLVANGVGYGVFDFRLQLTLEPESIGESPVGIVTSPEVKDAYLSMNEIPLLGRMRIGNFFVPFSLEQVTNDTNNIFLERSIPTQSVFTPDREVGLAFYNCNENQSITWSSGIFFDSISEALKERIDDNPGYRLSGRLTALPYYDEVSNGRYLVYTGLGILHTGDQDNRVRIRARPQIREGTRIINSGILQSDTYTIGSKSLRFQLVNRSEVDLFAFFRGPSVNW